MEEITPRRFYMVSVEKPITWKEKFLCVVAALKQRTMVVQVSVEVKPIDMFYNDAPLEEVEIHGKNPYRIEF